MLCIIFFVVAFEVDVDGAEPTVLNEVVVQSDDKLPLYDFILT
jgi:hypothetical protein